MTERPIMPAAEHLLPTEPLNSGVAAIVHNYLYEPTVRAVLSDPTLASAGDLRTGLMRSFHQSWRSLRTSELRTSLMHTLIYAQTIPTEDPQAQQVQHAARVLLSNVPIGIKVREMDQRVREQAANIYGEIVDNLPYDASSNIRNALIETGSILVRLYPSQGRAVSVGEHRVGMSLVRLLQLSASPDAAIRQYKQPLGEQAAYRFQSSTAETSPQALDDAVIALAPGRSFTEIANILQIDRSILRRAVDRLTADGRIVIRTKKGHGDPEEIVRRRDVVHDLLDLGMRPGLISNVTGIDLKTVQNDTEVYKAKREEAWQPSERTQRYVDGILNNPVKIVLAIELVRRKEYPPTAGELRALFIQLQQGQEDPYILRKGQARDFINNSLIPLGFAEVDPSSDEARYMPTAECEAGMALYGHMLALSEQITTLRPTSSLYDFFSASNVPGKPIGETGARRSPTTNLQIFSELARLWRAKALPVRSTDMRNITEHPRVLGDRLITMHERGILRYRSADADAPLEPPFEKLERSALSVSQPQGLILNKLVRILRQFEEGDNKFTVAGLGMVDEIMARPERMAKILRPLEKTRNVGPEAYSDRMIEIFDAADGDLSVRDVHRRLGASIGVPYARRLVSRLARRGEIVETASKTARRYRRATEAERAAWAAENQK